MCATSWRVRGARRGAAGGAPVWSRARTEAGGSLRDATSRVGASGARCGSAGRGRRGVAVRRRVGSSTSCAVHGARRVRAALQLLQRGGACVHLLALLVVAHCRDQGFRVFLPGYRVRTSTGAAGCPRDLGRGPVRVRRPSSTRGDRGFGARRGARGARRCRAAVPAAAARRRAAWHAAGGSRCSRCGRRPGALQVVAAVRGVGGGVRDVVEGVGRSPWSSGVCVRGGGSGAVRAVGGAVGAVRRCAGT